MHVENAQEYAHSQGFTAYEVRFVNGLDIGYRAVRGRNQDIFVFRHNPFRVAEKKTTSI